MGLSFTEKKSIRKNFGRLKETISIPNLIEVQKKSYKQFLSTEDVTTTTLQKGLNKVFNSVFPIEELSDKATLEYLSFRFEKPKFNVEECRQRDLTYASALKPTLRLVIYDIDQENNTKQILSAKEQEVYMGDIPLMTESGTFVVNGVERVVVNQMHRSPGVFFDHDKGKTHASGKFLFNCRIIPNRGSWLDFEYDAKDLLYFRIDRKRKLPITTFLLALGYTRNEILETFYDFKNFNFNKEKKVWQTKFDYNEYKRPLKLKNDLIDFKTGKKVLSKGSKINFIIAKKLFDDGLKSVAYTSDFFIGKYIKNDLYNPTNKEIFLKSGSLINQENLENIQEYNINTLEIADVDPVTKGPYLIDTLNVDKNSSKEEAINDIYKVLRPGEPPSFDVANQIFNNLFFKSERYDLSDVGRVKLNNKLNLKCSDDITILRNDDVIAIIKHMLDLKDGKGEVDDIDHLGNRRVRSVGELVENQFRIGILRMERAIKEKMSTLLEVESAMPQDLVNPRPITAALKDFFATSQLSQFMDQTNPLSEITHKRRVSALGPGGLTRERAGFEVRDVHPTHYGRICPIETPEGPNIGLIASLATFARVNDFGFIESPYRKVIKGKVTNKIDYLTGDLEENYHIAQANQPIDNNGNFSTQQVACRYRADFVLNHTFGKAPSVSINEFTRQGYPLNKMIGFVWAAGESNIMGAGGWSKAQGYYVLQMAGAGLLAMLDLEKELMPTGGYEVAHDLGRWWDAVLRLEETIGFAIPAEIEAASLRNLQRLTDNPDRLLMNRTDVPWLKEKAKINPHNFRETLLAFDGLVRRRQSLWARDAAMHLVRTMERILKADGSFDTAGLGSWKQVPNTQDPSHLETKRGNWFDGTATSGRAIVQTGVGLSRVTIVTGFAFMNGAVTTTRQGAVVETSIGLHGITVVTGFAFVDDAITATSARTVVQTRIGLLRVAVIAGFTLVHDTVTTIGRCAEDGAGVLIVGVAVVAGLKAFTVFIQVEPLNAIAATRHLASVGAGISFVDVAVVTGLKARIIRL